MKKLEFSCDGDVHVKSSDYPRCDPHNCKCRDFYEELLPVLNEDSSILRFYPLYPGDTLEISLKIKVEDFCNVSLVLTPFDKHF